MTIRWLFALALVLLGWIMVMALVMVLSDAAPAAVVFFPPEDFLNNVPEGTSILSRTSLTLTLQGETTDFGRALYHAGALFVLPAGLTGCLPLPKQP